MKLLSIFLATAVLLGGCFWAPYGPDRDGGYNHGGDRHEHHDDRHDDRGGY